MLAVSPLASLDWFIILAYFAVCAGIGYWTSRRVKSTENYFLGNRGFGKWLMITQSFGVGTHAEQPVSLAGSVYKSGFAGVWYQWKNMFVTPFYWLMAPIFRRCGRTTIAEVVEDRYGTWMGASYVVFAIIFFILGTGNMLKGAGKLIHGATEGAFGVNEVIIVMAVVFVIYSFQGGLLAAAWTDFFQSFLILVLSFMLIPLGWKAAGGIQGIVSHVNNPSYFSFSTPNDITPFLILALTLNGFIGIMAQPHIIASVGTGKDERDCRIGFTYGNFVKRFCVIGWAFVGILAFVILTGEDQKLLAKDSEDVFGLMCRRLMFPGALGLLIASVLAANMSTCSAFMVDAGAIFTRGFYDRFLAPGRTDRHYLWVGKISGFIVILISIIYAVYFVQSVLYAFLFTETMASCFGICILGGIIWKRANRWGALASLVTSTWINLQWGDLNKFKPEIFLYSMAGGILALVIISLLTPPEGESSKKLLDRLNLPSDLQESDPQKAGALSAARGDQLLLPNLFQLKQSAFGHPIFHAYRKDLSGFAVAWGVVLLLLAGTGFLLSFFKH